MRKAVVKRAWPTRNRFGKYRPTPLIVVALLVAAACGGSEESPTTTPTTTTPTTTTTTTTAPTTTTTMTVVEQVQFEGTAGTPVGELTSFRGTSEVAASLGELEIVLTSEGVFVGHAFRCESTVSLSGLGLTVTVVATPETFWVDRGQGFEESNLFDSDVDTAIGTCPASPLFWAEFGSVPFDAEGEPDTLDGIPAQRLQLTDFLGALAAIGLEDAAGVDIDQAVVWIADPGGWMAGLDINFAVAAEVAPDIFEIPVELTEPARLAMSIRITDPDDPTLTVEIPE